MARLSETQLKENLIRLRKKAGFSRRQVEEDLGLRTNTLYDVESGRLNLQFLLAVQLAEKFNCDLNDFVTPSANNKLLPEKLLPEKAEEDQSVQQLVATGVLGGQVHPIAVLMSQDPVIVSEVGIANMGHKPLMQLLMDTLTPKQQRDFVVEVYRYLNSLISIDGNITPSAMRLRDQLMQQSLIVLDERERHSIARAFGKRHLGKTFYKYFPREAHRHFLIWLLFLVCDGEDGCNHLELGYINEVAEHIQLNKSTFLYIQSQVNDLHKD